MNKLPADGSDPEIQNNDWHFSKDRRQVMMKLYLVESKQIIQYQIA
jgi:hypothetical protein